MASKYALGWVPGPQIPTALWRSSTNSHDGVRDPRSIQTALPWGPGSGPSQVGKVGSSELGLQGLQRTAQGRSLYPAPCLQGEGAGSHKAESGCI